jgi:Beta-lactamase/Putative esterase
VFANCVFFCCAGCVLGQSLPTSKQREGIGFSSERLARITNFFQADIDKGSIPGATLLIARDGKLVYLNALGYQDREKGIPMKPDAIFRIASMTKPIASVAVMMLAEEGKIDPDGPDQMLFTTLDNLIEDRRVPVMIAISIGNGSGDAQGSERGLEYDTMSGRYAEFVESEVLPQVETRCNVKLTKNADGRATMGCSSGAAAAMAMAWYRPDLYRRVLSYSGTYV